MKKLRKIDTIFREKLTSFVGFFRFFNFKHMKDGFIYIVIEKDYKYNNLSKKLMISNPPLLKNLNHRSFRLTFQ